MTIATMHPEDVKAAIRKRFGSVSEFERANALPAKSVTDLLRGRTSDRVSKAIEEVLTDSSANESDISDDIRECGPPHRLSAAKR